MFLKQEMQEMPIFKSNNGKNVLLYYTRFDAFYTKGLAIGIGASRHNHKPYHNLIIFTRNVHFCFRFVIIRYCLTTYLKKVKSS